MELIGKQDVDYFSKKNNKQVTGITLHCIGSDDRVNGRSAETLYIGSQHALYTTALNLALGAEFEPVYNKYGSLADLKIHNGK